MIKFRNFFLIFSLSFCVSTVNCVRILAAYPTLSRSHYIVAEALLKELANRGHDVTYF